MVEHGQFNAQLRQLQDPVPGDNIGMALTEALHRAIKTELDREQRPTHHFVNFAITAHGFTHAYQTANFTVGEILQRTARLDEMLATLASKLNSNEAFNPDRGFQVDVVFVSMPGPGSGRHKQRNVGRLCLDRDNKKKRCIVTIRNRDALCCARAIVTMRAHCHKDQGVEGFRDWENLKKGYPVQQRQAQELHREAGVAEGPCGLPELRQFQQTLGSQYQLLVMTRMKPFFLMFKGPAAPYQIRLLKSNDHFDGCTSFPAFVNRSYYCVDCERGFNTNDRTNHTCQGNRCRACGRFDCQDYVRGTRPTDYCSLCHCKFYGGYCKRHHVVSKQCQSVKTCLKCQAQYTVVPNRRHQCRHAKCPVCHEWVPIQDHKCYIQPVVEDEEPEPTEEGGGCMVVPPPPLFVYADFEAMQNAEGVSIYVLDGEDCALQFLRDLDDLIDIPDREDEREILVVFHNLKGFDGMFILHELYQQQREVADQLTVGAKVLSFKSGPLKFIDSLCFLPMPLASFPSTFNLTELKKGFFPHLFNTPDHQQYVGRIPDLEFYDHDGMMAKKKDELTHWHADQVRRNVTFNFKQEMIDYWKSDVVLLKAGCEAFQQEFERQAGFNPMAKCITIASACNLYWRKHHLTPDTIAVEPLGSWRGAQVNQSLKALQWLYYQEHQIPKEGLVNNEPAVSQFLASFDLVAPLEPCEAFLGARTGAVALHAVAGEGEEIRYVDVTFLYPWVNKNCPYPIGHPKIITQPADQSLDSYFGLATVNILPPVGLFHPVLPVCCGQKLTFPLCRSCVQEEQAQSMLTRTHYCPHSDADRTLRGTWCTPELVKAVEKGYTLIKIHEVWHFPPGQRQTGLFANYVNT